jgi:hypothetical protein
MADYEEFLDSLSDAISDLLLFATQTESGHPAAILSDLIRSFIVSLSFLPFPPFLLSSSICLGNLVCDVGEAFRGIEVAVQSLLAVGEEVQQKMRNPDLERKMDQPLGEIRKSDRFLLIHFLSVSLKTSWQDLLYFLLISLLVSHRCLTDLAGVADILQRSHKFNSRVRDQLLMTGQRMLVAIVRTLKFADIYDCLRVIRIIKTAVDSCRFFGEQVFIPTSSLMQSHGLSLSLSKYFVCCSLLITSFSF